MVHNLQILLFTTFLALAACRTSKDDGGPCTTEYGAITASNYILSDQNYACENHDGDTDDAIEDSFILDTSDLVANLTVTSSSGSSGTISAADIMSDVDTAIAAWLSAGARWKLDYNTGTIGDEEAPTSNVENQIDILDDTDPYADGSVNLAMTFRSDTDSDGTTDKCDIIFYTTRETDSSTIVFSVDSSPGSGEYDFGYTIAHEMGHCIGIGDQTDSSTASDLMYGSLGSGTDFSNITQHDQEAILWIYGI